MPTQEADGLRDRGQAPGSIGPGPVGRALGHDVTVLGVVVGGPRDRGPHLDEQVVGRAEDTLERDAVRDRDLVVQQVLAAGYGAVWLVYRTEVERGYHRGGPLTRDVRSGGEVFNRSPLEFEDKRAVVEYLAARPDIDGGRIAAVGCSHAGEMLLKLASGWDGLAAAVVAEPASHEFLALRRRSDEDVEHLQVSDAESVRRRMDLEPATARAAAIRTPLLVMGRDGDPLQGVFRATYDLLVEVGAPVWWTTHDHPEHGYVVPERRPDGTWADREGSLAALTGAIEFLRAHLGTGTLPA